MRYVVSLILYLLLCQQCLGINNCVDYINKAEYKQAEECINKVSPDHYKYYWLSLLYLEQQSYKKALSYAEKAYLIDPNNPYYQLAFGNLLIKIAQDNKVINKYLLKDNKAGDTAPYKLTKGYIFRKTDKLDINGKIVNFR